MPVLDKEAFFDQMAQQGLALTYDDVRLATQANPDEPLPQEIDIQSKFTQHIDLKVPFVSAAMDTVTTSDMAIAMAKLGGLGVIHAAMSVDEQRHEVRSVKKAVHGLIEEPRTVDATETLLQVLKRCEEKGYDFRTFPVIDSEGKLVGVLSGDDFKYPEDLSIPVEEAMTPATRVKRGGPNTTLEEAYRKMQKNKVGTLPLVKKDGSVAGMYLFSDVSRIHRDIGQYNVDENNQLISAAAVSTGKDAENKGYLERVAALEKYLDVVVIDTADGDSYYVFEALRAIKSEFPELDVMVGNISDADSARKLAAAGADGIKVGQGPGSICTTRRETGIGMPQVTAVHECIRALKESFSHIPVCADGGVKDHGDIPIAFAAGAHSVMMGRMLAGTEEAPGEKITRKDGNRWKVYRGMGSAAALEENAASRARYDAQNTGVFLPEGIEAYVPFVGSAEDVLALCILALRKGMRYVKAPNLTYHREHTRLFRITNSGLRESHPHDVDVIQY